MFIRYDTYVTSNPTCSKSVDDLNEQDFRYFDKDGFELNSAEQKFYAAMDYPIHHPILNHVCWQVPWYSLPENENKLFLDHAMVLQRCHYQDKAREQLESISEHIPAAKYLLQIRPKWGYDFDLNAVSNDGTAYEVLHVEYDTNNYDTFCERMIMFEQIVKRTDWFSVAEEIWQRRDEWYTLKGYDQNHWKAKYILGWDQAEYLEKAI